MLKKDNKKAHISDTLAGDEIQALQSADADQHRDRITRFGILKHRSKLQEQFLWTQVDFQSEGENEISNKALKAATKLKGCGQFLLFKNFYTIDQIKLSKFHVCGQHLLCPMCAGIRAARSMNRYLQRIDEIMRQNRKLKPVLITLTVKNGEDLQERFEHLTGSFRTLLSRYRDYKKKGRGFNQFCKIDGGFYTTEYTFNKTTNQWHPHIHIFALINDWIDQEELAETWHEITLDSYIVDVRRVKKSKDKGYSEGVAEVCKYALKFSDLSLENTWNAFLTLKGKRLTGSFGSMHGVKIPEKAVDEMPLEDLPYMEMLYRFVFDKKSYYNLEITKDVKPNKRNEEG
ncbi:protein rep [Acinetobacter variabilis]|uniref:protein rep n=1 Tax=Acinetobacter variabilis TaxID=70346 RepID=UPI0021BFC554|nr:protein rep [Acinetobacter variabilis]UXI53238.1 protein rep [Acinetobacter variabilis]